VGTYALPRRTILCDFSSWRLPSGWSQQPPSLPDGGRSRRSSLRPSIQQAPGHPSGSAASRSCLLATSRGVLLRRARLREC
jgi:hypothetical protein